MAVRQPTRGPIRARASDHLAVAVGTDKGLFIVSDGVPDGPVFKGCAVSAFLQSGSRYLAGVTDPGHGALVKASDDGGVTWYDSAAGSLAFPAGIDSSLRAVLQLAPDPSGPATALFAGTEPAALFRSRDGGTSFEIVHGLLEHPELSPLRVRTEARALHTVIAHPGDPRRILVGASPGGIFRSDDGGASWMGRNQGIESTDGQHCAHKLVFDAAGPDVLWVQAHEGLYRSENGGDSWFEVGRAGEEGGLPTGFGFPIVAHPVDAGTAFVFPLESATFSCNPAGRPCVWRTQDGGKSWEYLQFGLPPRDAYLSVGRDAFSVGTSPPYPLVFGTTTGHVFASADSGDSWRLVAEHLPPVLCVRVLD